MVSGLAMSRFGRGSSLLLPSLLPGKNDEAMEQKPLNDIRHHLHHLNSTQLNLPSNQSGEANGWFKTSSQSTSPTINTGLPCTPHAWLPQLRTGRCHHGQAARMPHPMSSSPF
ncbi:hypothetical protein FOVG_00720 [Fusarium oxysporum f. sp. pisi HDV247]|uniref:Uncharacterized protein n=1 Tax=Fusarium oxysporum f. sp. pisi HDV247 TaxID=1080344 RepID=W9QD54_FUSOX|nr:hypothetical protein FOVG_00720 [Fusarium oxysporum f. sp. pisi HDV247]